MSRGDTSAEAPPAPEKPTILNKKPRPSVIDPNINLPETDSRMFNSRLSTGSSDSTPSEDLVIDEEEAITSTAQELATNITKTAPGRPSAPNIKPNDVIVEDDLVMLKSPKNLFDSRLESPTPKAPDKPVVLNAKPIADIITDVNIETVDDLVFDKYIPASKESVNSVDLIPSRDALERSMMGDNKKMPVNKNTLTLIQREATKGLKKYYGTDDVEVRLVSHERDISEQVKHFKSGASKTPLSLHNFGLAGDYAIFIDGEHQDGTGKRGVEPYRVLGHFAKDKGLFWGWGWDSGHVGEFRYVSEMLKAKPELLDTTHVREAFDYIKSQEEVPIGIRGIMEIMSNHYGEDVSLNYVGNPKPADTLLTPINPFEDD